ncbi:hypothetical protein AX15_004080 [Amanita polypyramis BW_CC]|nr:hypothetical protein AX15_004080 [Amanita polypyramis BW_CC]
MSKSGLTLTVGGPPTIGRLADLQLTTTITNTSESPITLVNDPSSVLTSAHATERYRVIHSSSGDRPTFTGTRIKFSPKLAATLKDVTVLQPGESVSSLISTTHDLSRNHDFASSGTGKYTFKPMSTFYAVDPITKEVNAIEADSVSDISINIPVLHIGSDHGHLPLRAPANRIEKRVQKDPDTKPEIGFKNCTDAQQNIVITAANNAIQYINSTKAYLDGLTAGTIRYETWFGKYSDNRKKRVQSNFERMGNKPQDVVYVNDTTANPGFYARVEADDDTTVYLCPAFWDAPAIGTESQVHSFCFNSSSHF